MKKLVVMLVVVAFLATAGSAAADSPYRRVIIPKTGLSVAIQPLKLGEESNGVTAFVQESWSQAIYLPWAGLASPGGGLGSLKSGDAVLLHRDWGKGWAVAVAGSLDPNNRRGRRRKRSSCSSERALLRPDHLPAVWQR